MGGSCSASCQWKPLQSSTLQVGDGVGGVAVSVDVDDDNQGDADYIWGHHILNSALQW